MGVAATTVNTKHNYEYSLLNAYVDPGTARRRDYRGDDAPETERKDRGNICPSPSKPSKLDSDENSLGFVSFDRIISSNSPCLSRPKEIQEKIQEYVQMNKFKQELVSFASITQKQSMAAGPSGPRGRLDHSEQQFFSPQARTVALSVAASPNRQAKAKQQPSKKPSRNIYIREKFLPEQLTESILRKQRKTVSKANQTDLNLDGIAENEGRKKNARRKEKKQVPLKNQTYNLISQSSSSSEELQIAERGEEADRPQSAEKRSKKRLDDAGWEAAAKAPAGELEPLGRSFKTRQLLTNSVLSPTAANVSASTNLKYL